VRPQWTTQLRIIQANGGLVNGTVRINCVIEVDLTPEGEAAVERRRRLARLATESGCSHLARPSAGNA
jgi:hypothetical protein